MFETLVKKVTTAVIAGLVGWVGIKIYHGTQPIIEIFSNIRKSRSPRDSNWICGWETGKCLANLAWVWVEQKLNRTCIQHGKLYHLSFCIEGKMYRLCIRPKRGPEDFSATHNFVASPPDLYSLESHLRGYQSIVQPTLKNLNLKGVFIRTEDGLVNIPPEQSLEHSAWTVSYRWMSSIHPLNYFVWQSWVRYS